MAVGLRSLAVEFPGTLRTNDFYRRRQPEILRTASERALAKMWGPQNADAAPPADAFDVEMAPYLEDPFRGTVERRVLSPGETTLSVELRAAKAALAAAKLTAGDVDLVLSSAFVSDQVGIGHAAFLAKELGISGTAWNLETACSSSLEALRTAAALVRAGEHRTVLVVVSCMYSKVSDETDTATWFIGDGAAAFVVCDSGPSAQVLGSHFVHTGDTCGLIYYEYSDKPGTPRVCIRGDRAAGRVMRETAAPLLETCTREALRKSRAELSDVDFFVFNTPTAWYEKFAARLLGIDPAKTLSTYAEYANTGPALMPTNLHRAAMTQRIKRGDLVLLYAVGSVSSAGATLVRWGDVALGANPAAATRIEGREPA